MKEDDFRIYRRNLPHVRKEGAIYFVTWRLRSDQPELSSFERDEIAAALHQQNTKRYQLIAFVIMNDHVHVIFRPNAMVRLEELVQSWKSYTSHLLCKKPGRMSPVWLDEYFDRLVRNERELAEKIDYIKGNPWKRWPDLEQYPWLWIAGDD
jgi:putative transposase